MNRDREAEYPAADLVSPRTRARCRRSGEVPSVAATPRTLCSVNRPYGNTGCVPLYACERCGFTSAAFRTDAVGAHRLEHPECDGVMRIVFQSEDRYRGHAFASPVAPARAASTQQEEEALSVAGRAAFDVRERLEADGRLRLTLLGDLDLAAA